MFSIRSFTGLMAAGVLISAPSAIGQAQAAPAQATPAPAAQSASAQSSTTAPGPAISVLRANANLVLVDVVVTDHGNPVHGLDRGRFHVFEDGHAQSISAFDEHRPSPAPPAPVQPAELPPNTYTNVPVYPDTGTVNVLLLDALNTPMVSQVDVRRQMIEYMGKIKPGTELAIFTLSSQLRLIEGFTTNVAELTKALQSKKSNAQASVILDSKSDSAQQVIEEELANMEDPSHMPSAEAVYAMQQFEADLTSAQLDQRVRITMDAMQQLARYLSAIPGRKNLIWFSGSFPITVDPNGDQPEPFLNVRNYSDDMRKTSELLTAARVAVYPVDARGMMSQSTADAAYSPSRNNLSVNSQGRMIVSSPALNDSNVVKDYQNFLTQTMEEHGSMEQIAKDTGGKVYINTNDLEEAVAGAVENGASYYTIAYVPSNKKFKGHFRRIQVRFDGARYDLSYRRGYYADPTNKPSAHNPGVASLITTATLHGGPPATQVIFKTRVLAATDPFFEGARFPNTPEGEMASSLKQPLHLYLVDLVVDPHFVAFEKMPDGVHQAKLELVLVAYDADGKRVNYQDRSYAITIKPEDYDQKMKTGIQARLPIDLPAGQGSLRIAVQDLTAGRAGSLEVPVTVASK
ncbi:MAG: VWA domain-containing protein [Acidobacteriota bacterium]|nr:VWA domain-containing protein [Acidobacteriota bacterium]